MWWAFLMSCFGKFESTPVCALMRLFSARFPAHYLYVHVLHWMASLTVCFLKVQYQDLLIFLFEILLQKRDPGV